MYALDLPGMGYSQIMPGASYDEPAMRAAVTRLLTHLDLHDVTLLGESMGAVLAPTTVADLPDRVRRVVAVNAYDYAGGIARSSLLARLIVTGVVAPGVGPMLARLEPKPVMRAILTGGLADPLPRGHRTGPPHLRGEGLVPILGSAGQQATAARRRVHPGPERRPLHRPGTT
jgi:pimeloyl-ACP methyl ester carboxylesterase